MSLTPGGVLLVLDTFARRFTFSEIILLAEPMAWTFSMNCFIEKGSVPSVPRYPERN